MTRVFFARIISTILVAGHTWWLGFALGGGFPGGVENTTYVIVSIITGFAFCVSFLLSLSKKEEDV
jgi:hypothetical protein